MPTRVREFALALCVLTSLAAAARAQPSYQCVDANSPCAPKCGGPVNVSGATLFALFFQVPASTNDFIDANCDGIHSPDVQQLATAWNPGGQFWWIMQDRQVGSGNGLAEFVESNLVAGWTPVSAFGYINRTPYDPNTAGPLPPTVINLAVMDVPTTWFVRQAGAPDWTLHPLEPGYGSNAVRAWDANQDNLLKTLTASNGQSLNLNLSSPDARTVYDTPIAWVPVGIMANQGTGLQHFTTSDLRFLFATGRMPNGENLVACTRDSGSGTRNAFCNSLCLDPSFGRGDNLGLATSETNPVHDALGPQHQMTNLGGTGRMLATIQHTRLGVGYAGLVGSGANGAIAGKYEILDVMFDTSGGTQYVRPSTDDILHNCDVNNGYQIGGNETFASIGDPADAGYPMPESAARDYLNNIRLSIASFEHAPGDPNNDGSPGEMLATQFFLAQAVDCLPRFTSPCSFESNTTLNSTLQGYIAGNSTLVVPPFGNYPAGKTPVRAALDDNNPDQNWPAPIGHDAAYPPNGQYSDGSTNGSFHSPYDPNGVYNVNGGVNLNPRNHIAGDFNGDGVRNLNDIPFMVQAYYDFYVRQDPGYATYLALPGVNSSAADPVIPEILGDFNGDGNFDMRDIRYFCDGLAIDPNTGQLNRAAAFRLVDQTWQTLTGNNNFLGTVIHDVNGGTRPYVAGASAADVAGGTPWPGAAPHGYDGVVDCQDLAYVVNNLGSWTSLNDAVRIDLSCDMTGDLQVTAADTVFVQNLIGPGVCPNVPMLGDLNCDGRVDFGDINPFVLALSDPAGYQAAYPNCRIMNGDINGDGHVDFGDINPFVGLLTH